MRLVDEWVVIIKKAWSIRLLILAGVLSGVEVALPYFIENIPRGIFAALSAFFCAAAFVARLVAQESISKGANNG